jgi:hypothetical protein
MVDKPTPVPEFSRIGRPLKLTEQAEAYKNTNKDLGSKHRDALSNCR